MKRIFVIVTPICPTFPGRKVGSKECMSCDSFRGGIVTNFVDCDDSRAMARKGPKIAHKTTEKAHKTTKIAQPARKRGRPAKIKNK